MTVKGNVRRVQELENSAAEKAGIRALLIDEARLLGKGREAFIREFVEQLLEDIAPELKESAVFGVRLAEMVKGAGR